MRIVIDITPEAMEDIKNDRASRCFLQNKILNGTPLPKGHGDLIDKSNLLTITDYDGENEKTYVLYEEIEDAQPIIKADKESEG